MYLFSGYFYLLEVPSFLEFPHHISQAIAGSHSEQRADRAAHHWGLAAEPERELASKDLKEEDGGTGLRLCQQISESQQGNAGFDVPVSM